MNARFACPCCGYPTLSGRGNYDICPLCDWEDDGQDDADADIVMDGANADYSLTAARANFRRHGVMYEPGRDQRCTGGDTDFVRATKAALMEAYTSHAAASATERPALAAEIARLEQALLEDLIRRMREQGTGSNDL
jgi:hypothetical protein